jgi:hypothetical protein
LVREHDQRGNAGSPGARTGGGTGGGPAAGVGGRGGGEPAAGAAGAVARLAGGGLDTPCPIHGATAGGEVIGAGVTGAADATGTGFGGGATSGIGDGARGAGGAGGASGAAQAVQDGPGHGSAWAGQK